MASYGLVMYTRVSKSGGRHYLQIVESFRNEAGQPRQRVIANLMRVDQLEPGALDPLIRGLERIASSVGASPAPEVQQPTTGSGAEFFPSRALGHLFALHQIWSQLGLGAALRRCFRASRRRIDVEALVRAMVFNRLVEPRSKLGLLEWLDTVAMPDCPEMTHQQLLRAMDTLIDEIDAVEATVCQQTRTLLDQSVSMMFYDLTTVRYSGEETDGEWPIVSKGLAKETPTIQKQFVLGVVQSACGLPLLHTVAPGNVGETTTLAPMLKHALKRFPVRHLVIVADRGLLSLENIAEIKALAHEHQAQIDFILALPARRYREMRAANANLVFENGVAEGSFTGERMVVAYDPARAAEQRAARLAKLDQAEALGERLANKLDAQDEGQTHAGRRASDRGAYARFARELKDRKLSRLVKIDWHGERFSFDRIDAAISEAECFDGKLYLLTSLPKDRYPADCVIARYKALADIERGFRTLKSELLIAPVHHRLEKRIRAHALICFLALLMHRVMRKQLKTSGSELSPTAALRLLSTLQRHHVRIDNKDYVGNTRINPEQHDLFNQLNIPQPS
jgi:hypothetical protein